MCGRCLRPDMLGRKRDIDYGRANDNIIDQTTASPNSS